MPRAGVPGLHPKPRHGPLERVSETRILFRGALSVSAQNVRETAVFVLVLVQMLTRPGRGEGSAPGFGVRVMGCVRGRGRGVNGYRDMVRSAGALPGKILLRLPGACCIIPARICETVRRFCKLQSQSGRVKEGAGAFRHPHSSLAFPLGGRCPSAHTGADEGAVFAGRIGRAGAEGESAGGREKPPWDVPPAAPTQFSPVGPDALIGPLAWSQLKAGHSLADSAFAAEELKSCGGTAIF